MKDLPTEQLHIQINDMDKHGILDQKFTPQDIALVVGLTNYGHSMKMALGMLFMYRKALLDKNPPPAVELFRRNMEQVILEQYIEER